MKLRNAWPALALIATGAPAAMAIAAEPASPPAPVLRAESALRPPIAGHSTAAAALRAGGERARRARVEAERRRERARRAALPPILHRIAACESGGDPRAIGGGGAFRGKYQFMRSTWEAVGGRGDPARAPEPEQDRRAKILLERAGPSQWPVCSRSPA